MNEEGWCWLTPASLPPWDPQAALPQGLLPFQGDTWHLLVSFTGLRLGLSLGGHPSRVGQRCWVCPQAPWLTRPPGHLESSGQSAGHTVGTMHQKPGAGRWQRPAQEQVCWEGTPTTRPGSQGSQMCGEGRPGVARLPQFPQGVPSFSQLTWTQEAVRLQMACRELTCRP